MKTIITIFLVILFAGCFILGWNAFPFYYPCENKVIIKEVRHNENGTMTISSPSKEVIEAIEPEIIEQQDNILLDCWNAFNQEERKVKECNEDAISEMAFMVKAENKLKAEIAKWEHDYIELENALLICSKQK